jgi:hypothetical protein
MRGLFGLLGDFYFFGSFVGVVMGLMWDWVIIFIFFEFIINCWDFIVVSIVIFLGFGGDVVGDIFGWVD